MKKVKKLHPAPAQKIMAGFMLMILVGALLLTLPAASQSGESVGFLNALFTATSANCVTGLVVVNTMEHWTWFGKIVILTLIQLGGFGFITVMTLALLLARRKVTLRNRLAIQASFNLNDINGMVKLVRNVVVITALFELTGAVLLMISFYFTSSMSAWESVYQGFFHAISAFCNAGFDNIGPDGLVPYQKNVPVNLIIMSLIIAGGIGFPVWSEMGRFIKNPQKRSLRLRIIHLSLHTKLVFVVTGILLLSGMVFFLLLEWSNPETLGSLNAGQKFLAAMFQSVTLRTAGFNTIAQDGLTEASQAVSGILMAIGGSSASTAGGMKTVTLGVIVFAMLSGLRGRNNLEAFGRTLPLDLLQKALTVTAMMLIVIFTSTLLLYFTERGNPFPHTFLDLLFECSSAAGTVGLTAGITPHLSAAGKIVLIICMYLGRLGPVTVAIALSTRLNMGADGRTLLKERVMIG